MPDEWSLLKAVPQSFILKNNKTATCNGFHFFFFFQFFPRSIFIDEMTKIVTHETIPLSKNP